MTQPPRRGKPHRAVNRNWVRLQLFISSVLEICPPLKRLARYILWKQRLLSYQWRARRLVGQHDKEFDVDKTYWINPESIEYASLVEFNIWKDKGRIVGGDWDQLQKRFEDLDVYAALRERFVEGKAWQDTPYYQRILGEIGSGQSKWACKNKEDLDKRCEMLDILFQDIKNHGFKSKADILSQEKSYDPMRVEDEITVNVGRNGDFLFNNGGHRLSIAKLLGIQKIPVKITVRHPQWRYLKKQILLYVKSRASGKSYQPLTHPDLQDIPSLHDADSARFNIIQKNLSIRSGCLLDIGAHWGYFCHKFEQIGFDCYAVENDKISLYFLEKLRRAENRHFTVIARSIFEYPDVSKITFDVVLALNIFHHFLKNEDSYFKLLNLLKNLKMREMYFQPHLPDEPQMQGAYKNYAVADFVEFISQASGLSRAEFIGHAEDGRSIYKLS
jgi:hypothetical protein